MLDVNVNYIKNLNLDFIMYPTISTSSQCKQGTEGLIYEMYYKIIIIKKMLHQTLRNLVKMLRSYIINY